MIFSTVMRAQPFHLGHLSVIKYITKHNNFNFDKDEIVIVNGSANEKRTERNPFTWKERKEMITDTLKEEFGDELKFRVEHMDDYDEYMDWVNALKKVVGKNNAYVVGVEDVDFYSRLTGFKPIIVPETVKIHATQIREQLRDGKIPKLCPKPVQEWLKKNDGIEIVKSSTLKESYFKY